MVALLQGAYYLITGVWPILNRHSFEAITGPKIDFWLVRTIGALLTVIGAVLSLAGLRRKTTPEVALLGMGAAASLGGSDLIYTARRRIRRIYKFEALPEFGLIGLWLLSALLDSRSNLRR
jgi:hypothetical protein